MSLVDGAGCAFKESSTYQPHSRKSLGVRIADILTKMVYVKVAKVLLFKMMMIIAVMQKGEPMTDTEMERRKAICEAAHVDEIDDVSDGFHTFRQLYYQRMMLFAVIVKQNKDKAWKSLRHEDGELCFGGGWFVVGIDTPEGSYTYHYEDSFYSLFDCIELERGKHWDGHTEKDVTRLLSLPSVKPEPLSDAYMKAVWTWLLDYQIKAAELKGRYTPYEVLSWVANDWRKEYEGSD